MTRTAPLRRITLHFSHIGLTDARTFIAPVSSRIQGPSTSHESDGRVKHGPLGRPGKIAGDGAWPQPGPDRPFVAGCARAAAPRPGYLRRGRRLRRIYSLRPAGPGARSRPGRRRRRGPPPDPGDAGAVAPAGDPDQGDRRAADPRVRDPRRLL